MKLQDHLQQTLNALLEDIRSSIRYSPNRENDLLCFMEQYIKFDRSQRPALLQNIRDCMDGRPYPNPFAAYNHYDETAVCLLENLLQSCCFKLQKSADAEAVLTHTIHQINGLYNGSRGQLLDAWRGEKLEKLLREAAAAAGLHDADRLLCALKQW